MFVTAVEVGLTAQRDHRIGVFIGRVDDLEIMGFGRRHPAPVDEEIGFANHRVSFRVRGTARGARKMFRGIAAGDRIDPTP